MSSKMRWNQVCTTISFPLRWAGISTPLSSQNEPLPILCRDRGTMGGMTMYRIDTIDTVVLFEQYAYLARIMRYITRHRT